MACSESGRVVDSRREFLAKSAFGIGAFALAQLLQQEGLLAESVSKPGENLPSNLRSRSPHYAPQARAMISLFMHGGPSHVDLLDPKPELTSKNGLEYEGEVVYSFVNRANKKLLAVPGNSRNRDKRARRFLSSCLTWRASWMTFA